MKVSLTITIKCGKDICKDESGLFCKYYGAKKWCALFNQELPAIDGDDMKGYRRCDKCKNAEGAYRGATAGGGWEEW